MKRLPQSICDVLDQQPVRYEYHLKKHPKWYIDTPQGLSTIFVCPNTPSCPKSAMNAYMTLRRVLRSIGVDFVECKHLVR